MREMSSGREMNSGNSRRLVFILAGIILVILLVGLYIFVIKPSINGYATKLQNQGVVYTLSAIMSQLQQRGYVQIPISENQSITLIPPQYCSQFAQNSSVTLSG